MSKWYLDHPVRRDSSTTKSSIQKIGSALLLLAITILLYLLAFTPGPSLVLSHFQLIIMLYVCPSYNLTILIPTHQPISPTHPISPTLLTLPTPLPPAQSL